MGFSINKKFKKKKFGNKQLKHRDGGGEKEELEEAIMTQNSQGLPLSGDLEDLEERQCSQIRGGRKSKKNRKPKPPPWNGWNKLSPNKTQRKEMMYKCGKKCFLGPNLSFPVCEKNTCKINRKGLHSAYIRAAQWGKSPSKYGSKSRPRMPQKVYTQVKKRAKQLLNKTRKN